MPATMSATAGPQAETAVSAPALGRQARPARGSGRRRDGPRAPATLTHAAAAAVPRAEAAATSTHAAAAAVPRAETAVAVVAVAALARVSRARHARRAEEAGAVAAAAVGASPCTPHSMGRSAVSPDGACRRVPATRAVGCHVPAVSAPPGTPPRREC